MTELLTAVPQDAVQTCGKYEPFGFSPARYYNADGYMTDLTDGFRLFCLPSARLLEWKLIGPRCSVVKKGVVINKPKTNSFYEAIRSAEGYLEHVRKKKEAASRA